MSKKKPLTLISIGGLVLGLTMMPKPAKALSTTEFMLNAGIPVISISIDPTQVGNNNIKQLGNVPSSASFYKTANIDVVNVDSYAISVFLDCSAITNPINKTKCESGNLLTNSGDTLSSVNTAKTFSTMSNEWGFRYGIGDDVVDLQDKYFISLPTNRDTGFLQLNGEEQIQTSDESTDSKTLTLGFGAKIDGNTSAGVYNGKVTVAVVASPAEPKFNGITTMQAMDSSICATANIHDTVRLKDERDGKYYWVTKLEDQHCWMSQNLDLDLYVNTGDSNVYAGTFDKYVGNSGGTLSSTGVKLTKNNTDITTDTLSATLMPKSTTQNVALTGVNVNNGDMSKHSWDQGMYVIKDPTNTTGYCTNNNGMNACSAYFTDVSSGWVAAKDPNFTNLATYQQDGITHTKTAGMAVDNTNKIYDAHYLIGNYYQFNAATAGSATNGNANIAGTDNGHAPDSLCPKGWKLPSSNTMDDVPGRGGFPYMLSKYGIATGVSTGQITGTLDDKTTNIALSPLFSVQSGRINSNESAKFNWGGWAGWDWSARVNGSDINKVYDFSLNLNAREVQPTHTSDRNLAVPMRCVMY